MGSEFRSRKSFTRVGQAPSLHFQTTGRPRSPADSSPSPSNGHGRLAQFALGMPVKTGSPNCPRSLCPPPVRWSSFLAYAHVSTWVGRPFSYVRMHTYLHDEVVKQHLPQASRMLFGVLFQFLIVCILLADCTLIRTTAKINPIL